jgi:hypothetical protein
MDKLRRPCCVIDGRAVGGRVGAATASLALWSVPWAVVSGWVGYVNGWTPTRDRPAAGRRRPRLDRAFRDKKQARTNQTILPSLPPSPVARLKCERAAAAAGTRGQPQPGHHPHLPVRGRPRSAECRGPIPTPAAPACHRSGTGTYAGRPRAAHPATLPREQEQQLHAQHGPGGRVIRPTNAGFHTAIRDHV